MGDPWGHREECPSWRTRSLRWGCDTEPLGLAGDRDPGADPDLPQDGGHVVSDGLLRDEQPPGDLQVREVLGEQAKDLPPSRSGRAGRTWWPPADPAGPPRPVAGASGGQRPRPRRRPVARRHPAPIAGRLRPTSRAAPSPRRTDNPARSTALPRRRGRRRSRARTGRGGSRAIPSRAWQRCSHTASGPEIQGSPCSRAPS